MGVRETGRSLEQWQMGIKDLRRRMIPAPAPRERERWYAALHQNPGLNQTFDSKASFGSEGTFGSSSVAVVLAKPVIHGIDRISNKNRRLEDHSADFGTRMGLCTGGWFYAGGHY